MQDSWKQLKSDSISWQMTLKNSHNSQIQWHVVSFRYHNWPERLESREHQNWTRIGSHNSYLQGKYGVEIRIESLTKTILTPGSEFLMAWTNWSQTWSTRSTTTTSRRPIQRRRKYLRLQADPRLKQNQEDLQLLAHLQGLYLFLKEHGLILNQDLNSIKLTQWQKRINTLLPHGELTVFFLPVDPMDKNHKDPHELDLTKQRLASYERKCEVHQDTVYWVDFQLAQRKGLKFYQTRSNAVILYDTLPAYCISKANVMKSEEIINQKVPVSPRPPPTISF